MTVLSDISEDTELRRVFGRFPTGVTALCAVDGDKPVGMTASAFVAISLKPALVSVCIKHGALGSASSGSVQGHSPLPEGERPAPQNALTVRLLMAREAAMSHLRPVLRAHGLTEQQYRVLRALQFAPPTDATSLAERAVLLPPSLSRILRDLSELGLVEKVPGVNAKRLLLIQLSEKGRAATEKAASDIDQAGRRIAGLIGHEQLGQLMALLEQVERTLTLR